MAFPLSSIGLASGFGRLSTDPLYTVLPRVALVLGLLCLASFIVTRILRHI